MLHTLSKWRAYAVTLTLTLLGFTGLTAVMVEPWVNFHHLDTAIYPGDPSLVAWTIAWDSHALLTGAPLFSANVFFPAPDSLAYIEHHLGVALFGLPIYALTTNPVITYNVLWCAAFLLNALACYALARHLALPRLPSAIGATIYAFSGFRMLHQGHLQLQWSFWFPLVLMAIRVWFRDGRLMALAVVPICVLLQMLVSGYMAVMVVLLVGLYAVWTAGWSLARLRIARTEAGADGAARVETRATLLRLGAVAAMGVLAASIAWPAYAPYTRLAPPETREAAAYSATASSYVLPALSTVAGQLVSLCFGIRGGDIFGEQTLYLGIAAMALALVAIADTRGRTRREATAAPLAGAGSSQADPIGSPIGSSLATCWFFVVLGVIACALSFGPSPDGSGWRLFDLASMIGPVALFRAPARFGLLVLLAVSVLAAFGAASIAGRYGRKGQIVLLALFPLMIAEYRPLSPSIGKPQPSQTPRLYKVLAQQPPGALVSLPSFRDTPLWWREADYMLYSTRDWRPIVNGYGRSEPDDYDWIIGHMRAFPGQNSAKTMRRLGVRYVMLHTDRFVDGKEAAAVLDELRASPHFAVLAQDGPVLLVAVNEVDEHR